MFSYYKNSDTNPGTNLASVLQTYMLLHNINILLKQWAKISATFCSITLRYIFSMRKNNYAFIIPFCIASAGQDFQQWSGVLCTCYDSPYNSLFQGIAALLFSWSPATQGGIKVVTVLSIHFKLFSEKIQDSIWFVEIFPLLGFSWCCWMMMLCSHPHTMISPVVILKLRLEGI